MGLTSTIRKVEKLLSTGQKLHRYYQKFVQKRQAKKTQQQQGHPYSAPSPSPPPQHSQQQQQQQPYGYPAGYTEHQPYPAN